MAASISTTGRGDKVPLRDGEAESKKKRARDRKDRSQVAEVSAGEPEALRILAPSDLDMRQERNVLLAGLKYFALATGRRAVLTNAAGAELASWTPPAPAACAVCGRTNVRLYSKWCTSDKDRRTVCNVHVPTDARNDWHPHGLQDASLTAATERWRAKPDTELVPRFRDGRGWGETLLDYCTRCGAKATKDTEIVPGDEHTIVSVCATFPQCERP